MTDSEFSDKDPSGEEYLHILNGDWVYIDRFGIGRSFVELRRVGRITPTQILVPTGNANDPIERFHRTGRLRGRKVGGSASAYSSSTLYPKTLQTDERFRSTIEQQEKIKIIHKLMDMETWKEMSLSDLRRIERLLVEIRR